MGLFPIQLLQFPFVIVVGAVEQSIGACQRRLLTTVERICSENTDDSCSSGHYRRHIALPGSFDDFSLVYEDVESYVKYAKEMGFKRIVLAGHSLGSNKIIHYLGNTPDNFVDYFIVSAPVDLSYWFSIVDEMDYYLETARSFVAQGRGKDILPFIFFDFSPMCADTLLGFYNAFNLKNCPVLSGDGETESLASIKINGAFVIGEKDSMAGGNPKEFMENINSYCKNPEQNRVIVVPEASHIFYGKHEEYASTLLECVQQAPAFV